MAEIVLDHVSKVYPSDGIQRGRRFNLDYRATVSSSFSWVPPVREDDGAADGRRTR